MPPARQAARQAQFEALVLDVGDKLRRYARRRVDRATADDVVADAFLVIWRRLDEVPAGHELPWCYAVTRLCLANALRAQRRHEGLLRRLAALASQPDDASRRWDHEAAADPELRAALRSLRRSERELLWLWAWEDLPPHEIAIVLGISSNAASIRLHRARRRLADQLTAPGGKTEMPAGHRPIDEGRSV